MPNIVKNTTIINVFDLLAPHSCRGCGRIGSVLCNRCKKYIISHRHNYCPICKTANQNGFCLHCPNFPRSFIIDERSDLLADLVHSYKYQSIRSLSIPLSEILDTIIPPLDGVVEIVPLPTISRHIRERGFDHTLLIAKHLAKKRHWSVNQLLTRSDNHVQVGSTKKVRLRQARDTYTTKSSCAINPSATYLLLDDVWTTGASMQSAIKKLQEAGANNIVIALLTVSRIN